MGKIIKTLTATITLSILMILLVLTLSIKTVTKEIIDAAIKKYIPEETLQTVEEASDEISELLNNQELLDKIKEKTGIEISKEKIEEKIEEGKADIEKKIEEEFKQRGKAEYFAWKFFQFLQNTKLKGILIILMGLEIIIIMLCQKSIFKWIKNACYSLVLSGGLLYGSGVWIRDYLQKAMETSEITLNAIISPALFLIVTGVIIYLIYCVIARIMKIIQKESTSKEEKKKTSKKKEEIEEEEEKKEKEDEIS